MNAPTRMAGRGRATDGSEVTWTVAEGRRGRRWREVVRRHGTIIHALLLETDRDGRFSYLELARADGLWTFHPETDGTLHGNRVGGDPLVRHVVGWAFAPDDVVLVAGSPISAAAIAWARATVTGVGATAEVAGVIIGAEPGSLVASPVRVERLSPTRWRVGEGSPFEIDPSGLPVLDDGLSGPLELA